MELSIFTFQIHGRGRTAIKYACLVATVKLENMSNRGKGMIMTFKLKIKSPLREKKPDAINR